MTSSIFDLWFAVVRHPDFAGGTIFIHGGDTRTLSEDELNELSCTLSDRLSALGNEIIDDLGFGPGKD